MIGLVLVLIFVLLPLAAGILLVGLSRRGGLGYPACGGCKYDLSGSIGVATRCPECGADFANVGIVPPKGRRNRIMVWTGVVLIVVPLTCVGMSVATVLLSLPRAVPAQQSVAQQGPAAVGRQQPASQPAATPSAAETQQDEDG